MGVVVGLMALAVAFLALANRVSPDANALAGLSSEWSTAVRGASGALGLFTIAGTSGLVIWRQPHNLFSWALAATAVMAGIWFVADEYAVYGLSVRPGSLPIADVAAYSPKLLPELVAVGAITAILLFPDGRLKSRRWSIVIAGAVIAAAASVLSGLGDPFPIWTGLFNGQPVPVTVPPAFWPIGAAFGWASSAFIWLSGVGLVSAAGVLVKMAAARGDMRRQLQWFAYAASIYLLAALLGDAQGVGSLDWLPAFLYEPLKRFGQSDAAAAIAGWGGLASLISGSILVPVAIGIAIIRYRLYDIDVVVNRTILFAGLAIFVTGAYAILVAGASSLLGQRAGSNSFLNIVTIAVVAALLLPVRSRVQALADVAVYGRSARPYDVLSDFARSIGAAEPAARLLPRMADLLREGTRSAASEVWVKVDERLQLAVASPTDGSRPVVVDSVEAITARHGDEAGLAPVHRDGELLGVLVVIKPRGEHLNHVERRLLDDLASQAGMVFERFRLVQELRESRTRIVAAQEAERRRIERNLHDGAQQRFVNALLSLGLAGTGDSGRADLLDQASREVQAGLGELRDLARGLNPPLLAESGIAAAARSLADRSSVLTTVTSTTEERYPEAVESAAYYVISEAMTNVSKHAGAKTAAIRIARTNEVLEVEVADDGAGGADARRGSGLVGLHDRTAAVGGRLFVDSPPGGGTTIRAELPCA